MSRAHSKSPVRIGLLGRGTVGGAFAELLAERAEAVEAATGRRAEIAGVLTRDEGDFGEILGRSDLIVELIGGTDPARQYVLDALRAGRPVVTANKQLLAQHGDELFALAREMGVQLRFEAAVAGAIPIVRVIQESFGVTEVSKVVRHRQRHHQLHPQRDGRDRRGLRGGAGPRPGAGLRRGRSQPRTSTAPTPRPRWRSSPGSPSTRPSPSPRFAYEGIETIQPDDLAYAKELGLSLKLLGVAERRDGGISVRVFPCFLYQGHPLSPVEGPFNAVMVEAPAITEVTMSGPGAGGVQTASAVLGDVVSILAGEAPSTRPARSCRSSPT